MEKDSKIYVAGHTGLVGSALVRKLNEEGYSNLVTRTRSGLDLIRQSDVEAFFEHERPEYVFLAAAKVGGIWANDNYPADFIYENLLIQAHVIHASWRSGVKRLLFLGSSCIYPRDCPQPMKEEYLLTGPLEPTNAPYAIAKIAGIKMCQSYNRQYGTKYLSVMPTNLYGPNDNFDLETSHALPALIRKFHEAKISNQKTVEIWGTGTPYREFLYVDDLADACLFMMNLGDREYGNIIESVSPFINIGSGDEVSINELAVTVQKIIGFDGTVTFDPSKPDGTPRKLLDITRMSDLGWKSVTALTEGLRMAYSWCLRNSVLRQ